MVEKTSLDLQETRKQLQLATDKPVLLFFGFVRTYKGLIFIKDSLEIIISEGQEVHLIITGEFWENPKKFESQIKCEDLTNYVLFPSNFLLLR